MHIAVATNHCNLVRLLLDNGASAFIRNRVCKNERLLISQYLEMLMQSSRNSNFMNYFIKLQQGNTPFNLAISKQHANILRMLEEHSGGNYPFPVLEQGRGEATHENSSTIDNAKLNKHLSNSAESINRNPRNLAPSKYYSTDQLKWRFVLIYQCTYIFIFDIFVRVLFDFYPSF